MKSGTVLKVNNNPSLLYTNRNTQHGDRTGKQPNGRQPQGLCPSGEQSCKSSLHLLLQEVAVPVLHLNVKRQAETLRNLGSHDQFGT